MTTPDDGAAPDRDEELTEDYLRLQDRLESVLWASSNSINDLKRAKRKLQLEISKRKELENELALRQKLESIGQLAAGVAHEINTPMQYIGDNVVFLAKAFDELLRALEGQENLLRASSQAPPENRKLAFVRKRVPKALESAKSGVEAVSGIVQAMKAFSHLEESMRPCDINDAIEKSVTVSRNEWKYVAEVTLDLAPDLPRLECYGAQLRQVVLNMVVNAAHAIKAKFGDQKKGEIRITTRYSESDIEILISDNGSGIPAAIRDRIFDPFFTTKPVGSGTGQGLALAHCAVSKHNGTIQLTSEEGEGTSFLIRLPLQSQNESAS